MGWSIKAKIVLVTLVLLMTSTSIVTLYLAHLQQQHPVTETLWNILFRQDFLLVFIFTLLISLIITIAFAYTLIEPVDKLIIGTQLVGQGQLDYQIRKYSNDEIGRLVEAFNEMIRKLRSSIEKETKSSEKALLEQTKAALIIDSMADGVIVTDHDHKVVLFNRVAEKIFDLSASKILGKNILHMRKSGIASIFYDLFEDEDLFLNKKDSIIVKEFISKEPKKMLKATIGPLRREYGKKKIGGSVIVLEDITKLREIENMKTEFIGIVSHELKTPLTGIRGYAELLHMGKLGPLDEKQKKAVDIIVAESQRLTTLINDLLDLSKLESGGAKLHLQEISLEECLDQSPALYMIKDKGIEFKKIIPYNLPHIYADKNKMMQVFTNILSNAAKFTPKNGSIIVRFTVRKDSFFVSVKDTGIGIAKKHLPHLFDKFYQVETHLRRKQGGTGLGLPILKEIIALHRGLITVESKVKRGTTISFTISRNLGEQKKEEENAVKVLQSRVVKV